MSDTNTRRRVKLYMLNESRVWDDQGTGHVTSAFLEKYKGMSLLVRSEIDGSVLLESKIQLNTAYQKQQETLIVWSEADSYDYALSFQDKAGCDEIWEKICQVQGKDPSVEITQDVVEQESEDMDDDRFDDVHDTSSALELPPCELSRLEDIADMFNSVLLTPVKREKLSSSIESEGYIRKLLDLFHMCEDLDNTEGLHHLYSIFKSIFLLNKTALFEIMFADDVIFDVVGVLEYDPSLIQPARHRDYLRTQSKLKEVIPLNNSELVQKIHQTYRVQYIQDVILPTPSVFEENLLSTLSSFIYFNKMEIVTMIQEDDKFLQMLFGELTDDDTDDSKRRDLILFLKEFCNFSQTLAQPNREGFFKTLSNLGILNTIEVILGLDDPAIKSAAVDIFSYIVEFNPSMVRDFVLRQAQKHDDEDLLINMIIEQMTFDTDPELGGAMQLMSIIRLLIDPENMKMKESEFLAFFYKHCMHVLTAPLFANTVNEMPAKDDYQTAQLLSIILELLTFCIEHHTYHIKNYIFNKEILKRSMVLLKSRHAFLCLSALRMLRRVIGLKDEAYNRHIAKSKLFKCVSDAFKNNGQRYNLFNSAVIELFEFIRNEDLKVLINDVVKEYFSAFESATYVQTFKVLKQRYDQHQDRLINKPDSLESITPQSMRTTRFRRDARTLEEEEEVWFEQDDDLDDSDVGPKLDLIKTKLDMDYEPISKFLSANKSGLPGRKSPPPSRLLAKNSISININATSPTSTTGPTPASSPANSPSTSSPANSPNTSSPANSPTTSSLADSPALPSPASGPVESSLDSSPSTSSPGDSVSSSADSTSPTTTTPSPTQEHTPTTNATKKHALVGLVDYPADEDSGEEEDGSDLETSVPSAKRPRLTT